MHIHYFSILWFVLHKCFVISHEITSHMATGHKESFSIQEQDERGMHLNIFFITSIWIMGSFGGEIIFIQRTKRKLAQQILQKKKIARTIIVMGIIYIYHSGFTWKTNMDTNVYYKIMFSSHVSNIKLFSCMVFLYIIIFNSTFLSFKSTAMAIPPLVMSKDSLQAHHKIGLQLNQFYITHIQLSWYFRRWIIVLKIINSKLVHQILWKKKPHVLLLRWE